MRILNWLLKQSNKKSYNAFDDDIGNYMLYQKNYLLTCIRENSNTIFGKNHDFTSIDSIEEYQKKVPVSDYAYHEDYILDCMDRKVNSLVNEDILLFELSSGSTSASKFIPYTKGLKDDFMAGVKPWLYNLYRSYPSILSGKSYWSISPIKSKDNRTSSGVPIGFEDDTGYFDFIQSYLFKKIFVVPSEVKYIEDIEDFRHVTLLFLLSSKKLSFVSVWNPTFFTLLLDHFEKYKVSLTDDIEKGEINPPNKSKLPMNIYKSFRADKKRASEIRNNNECSFSSLWPNLKVISCWDQGNSGVLAKQLSDLFENIVIQGKGLLATEGLVSIPLEGIGHVISYKSHFFEFIDISSDRVYLLDELELNKKYSILMTTRGGLYRYRLYDIVEVTGYYKGLPCIEFISKESNISDYYGEKLNEYHVKLLFDEFNIQSDFYFIAPCKTEDSFYYCLFVKNISDDAAKEYKMYLENGLCKNFHYEYARHLGQINNLEVFVMTNGCEESYYKHLAEERSMKLGDIKYQILNKTLNFHKVIKGYFIK